MHNRNADIIADIVPIAATVHGPKFFAVLEADQQSHKPAERISIDIAHKHAIRNADKLTKCVANRAQRLHTARTVRSAWVWRRTWYAVLSRCRPRDVFGVL